MRNAWRGVLAAAWLVGGDAGIATAAPGDFQWNRGWDATGFADMDDGGAVGAAGMFFGTLSFGGGPRTSANPFTGDVWVARYAANGAHQWSRSFTPGLLGVTVTAVACSPNGGTYVAGTIINNGNIDFGGGALAGNAQMWIAKFDDLGNHLWSDTFGIGQVNALDADQNLLAVGGQFFGPIDFGGGTINTAGSLDAFVALLHGGAAHVWSAGFGDINDQRTTDVDVDVSGTIVATGGFQGTVDFGGGNLFANATPDLFLAKYDPAGGHVWSQRFAGGFGGILDVLAAVAQDDGAEHVALLATAENVPVDLGGGAMPVNGGTDVVLAVYDEAGGHKWSERYGSGIDDQGQDVAFDLGGNVMATGAFQNVVAFGSPGGPLVSNGAADLFVSTWAVDGTALWSRHYGTVNGDTLCRLATDPNGDALLFGSADNGVNFGGGALADAGVYLAKVEALSTTTGAPAVATGGAASPVFAPNPFRAGTELRFEMPRAETVRVTLHDVTGRRIRALGGTFAAGAARIAWDGRDDAGRGVPAGVYFWRIEGPEVTTSGRITRLR